MRVLAFMRTLNDGAVPGSLSSCFSDEPPPDADTWFFGPLATEQKTNCTNPNITQNGASAPDAVQRRAVAAVERHVVVVGFDGGAIRSDASALLSGAKRLIEHGVTSIGCYSSAWRRRKFIIVQINSAFTGA